MQKLLELPIPERLRAVEEIWDGILETPDALPVPQAHLDELKRRLELHCKDPDAAISWEAARARLLGDE